MIQPHDRIYVAGHRGMVGSACVRAFVQNLKVPSVCLALL